MTRISMGLLALGCALMACGDDDESACIPGATAACLGAGRCEGVQICAADGRGYGVCSCPLGDAGLADAGPVDAGEPGDASTDARAEDMGAMDADPVDAGPPCENAGYEDVTHRWNLAGVTGGIRDYPVWGDTLVPGDDIQAAIDAAPAESTIMLGVGDHDFDLIEMKSGVVLRGVDRATTRLVNQVRQTLAESAWNAVIQFGDLSNRTVAFAGLENLTYYYRVDGCEPPDDLSGAPDDFYAVHTNDPCGRNDLHTNAIQILGHDNWLRSIDIIESGSDMVILFGDHNTVENIFINRSYNKGPNGSGYYYCAGSDNLTIDSSFNRMRHVTIDGYGGSTDFPGAWNVFENNELFRVEFNFHNGDEGYNLVEYNTVSPEATHHVGGQPFNTGVAESHLPPGLNNYIYNNDTSGSGRPGFAGEPGVIYTTDGTYDSFPATDWPEPACGQFYTARGTGH